jgi:sterol desaturase/sphingolipid hydroxylase (fatty acid hydroxylase superfamily)
VGAGGCGLTRGIAVDRIAMAVLAAGLLGSLVEYLAHRFYLHARRRTRVVRRHRMHHKTYVRYSLLSEFFGFFPAAVPFLWLGFLGGRTTGVAFAAGGAGYVLLVAACHKLSHQAPRWLFWLNPNLHALHHDRHPRCNYGITTSLWDRVFGTYRRA